jgi:uncharacterized membrane protein YphA (DoxX/SURF4 family)
MRLSHIPPRVATGAFILNTGLGKLRADEATATGVHGMAVGTYPFLAKTDPKVFVKALGVGEVVLGATLLSPFVSPLVAGAALMGFSGSLLQVYRKTPGLTRQDGVRPTQQGTPIAKDVWMFGIGLGLVLDALTPRRHRHPVRNAKRSAQAAAATGAAKAVKVVSH